MIWLLMVFLFAYGLFLRLRLQIELRHFDSTQARIQLRIAGLHKTWQLLLVSTPQGHHLVLADKHGLHPLNTGTLRQGQGRKLLTQLRNASRARHFLLHHIHLEALEAFVLLRTDDAAHSALLSGFAQSILSCLPIAHQRNVRIRFLPDFFRAHSTVNARCIISLQMGTILLTALMLLTAWIRGQRQQKVRQYEYGTPHR